MSRALSSRTIVAWSVGLAVGAVVAVTALWVFLGGDDPADARRLDAIRTASSLALGAGGAAALLLAARRQRYVELDLEQKEHDANERRVTELSGKAADQLGNDKAPVRLAGAPLGYFWFRECVAREGNFSFVTFHEMAAFRDSRFTGRAYFQGARFTGTAD